MSVNRRRKLAERAAPVGYAIGQRVRVRDEIFRGRTVTSAFTGAYVVKDAAGNRWHRNTADFSSVL